MAIKFNQHHVTNGTDKARVSYHYGPRIDGTMAVVLYSKDYGYALGRVIEDGYQNDTDSQTDYFDKGRVVIRTDSPLFEAAKARAELNAEKWDKKWNARHK